ncbi:heterokaryon incompatibility protein-domain-containing protein [Xylariaceae sp. FL1019]|nr:heterokaryon incompatibility protein-domain-containing protein [Xylariaceae sp. FL1019]
MLCPLCASIRLDLLLSEGGYDHVNDVRVIVNSALTCDLCRLILDEALEKPLSPKREISSLGDVLEDLGIDTSQTVALVLRIEDELLFCNVKYENNLYGHLGRDPLRIFHRADGVDNLEIVKRSPQTLGVPLIGARITELPDLARISSLVQGWVDECTHKHAICGGESHKSPYFMPTRTLDVDFGDPGAVRLVSTSGLCYDYVALSHCWGDSRPLRTTKANFNSHQTLINIHNLPQPFRDAVSVTRSIGIKYLWIDSLCIVQDDKDDWEREAPTMGDIYGNAFITIAASRCTSSTSGFLGACKEDKVVSIPSNGSETLYISRRHSFARDMDNAPLATRAWVVQERILSRRTIHFTSTQVYWECWASQVGENLDMLYPGVVKHEAYPQVFAPGGRCQDGTGLPTLPTPRQWWHLVTAYTSCGLTYQKDKLVAIEGLIRRISQHTGHRAIAGIFEDVLHAGLLWSACDEPLEKITEIQAPSWSWASRKGRINYMQLYEWAKNDDVQLGKSWANSKPTLRAPRRKLRPNLCISDLKDSREYDSFPPELDYHATRFRFVYLDSDEGQDNPGWLTIDDDTESATPDWDTVSWVVVACNLDSENSDSDSQIEQCDSTDSTLKEGPFYCMLVRLKDNVAYERIGIGAAVSMSWFDELKEEIIIG